jgi:uncharacterized protein
MAKAQAQEPSMEEILASIRRIIADEEAAPKGAKAPEPEPELDSAPDETISEDDLDKLFASAGNDEPAAEPDIEPEPEEEEDVLDLTDELVAEDPPLVEGLGEDTDLAFEDPDVAEIEMIDEPEPEPVPPPAPRPVMAAAPEPAPAPRTFVSPPQPLVEPEHLVSQATEGFVNSAFSDLALTVLNRNARTVEDLVQDMLRPMLKGWLDQNLPTMVERMVRAEIERVSRGR